MYSPLTNFEKLLFENEMLLGESGRQNKQRGSQKTQRNMNVNKVSGGC